jgi:hypothetical protein
MGISTQLKSQIMFFRILFWDIIIIYINNRKFSDAPCLMVEGRTVMHYSTS